MTESPAAGARQALAAAERCRPTTPCGLCDKCIDEREVPCPGCGRPVVYDAELDVFDHGDDHGNGERCRLDRWRGNQLAALDRKPVDREPVSMLDLFEASLLTSEQIAALPPPEWLIADYLVQDSLAMLFGPSGTCKTFLALCWAQHVSTGLWWHGHEVTAGPVFYVIAEGARGIGRRLDAWNTHYGDRVTRTYTNVFDAQGQTLPRSPHDITWRPRAVNLSDQLDVEPLLAAVTTRKPRLIVVDTLARNTLGTDENSAKDMGVIVAVLDRIRQETGACVLVVHHTGKDGAAGARGSSAFKAAMDTEIEITAIDHRLVVKVTKQKDSDEARPLRLDRLTIGDSCVLVPTGSVPTSSDLGPGPLSTLEALKAVMVPGGIATSVWEGATEASRRTFYTHRKMLLERGLVANVGTDQRPRYEPVMADEAPDEGGDDDPEF